MTDIQKQAIDRLEAALARTKAVLDPASLDSVDHAKYVRDAHVIQSWCNADGLRKLLTVMQEARKLPSFNEWWLSLPEARRHVLLDDSKWALAQAAYDAAHGIKGE